jgi:Domain of unknown function (DUF4123)
MNSERMIEFIGRHLFSEEGMHAYAVLDGASVPNLRPKIYNLRPEQVCLYRGELKPDMAEIAPYLVRLELNSAFTKWVINDGWGKHWGIFAVTRAELNPLRTHFRRFLMVHDSDGKPLYFRYYDPRVLRVYLPTCTAQELKTVFGPVEFFLLEDEDKLSAVRFRKISGALHQERLQS